MARILLHRIGSELDAVAGPEDRERNARWMAELDAGLAEKVATVHAGWGPEYVDRVHEKGKWTSWERIDALLDPESPRFEVGTLVNWGRTFAGSKRLAPGAGVITLLGRIHDRWTVVIANDNTVASGAWWPLTPEKIERAQKIALRLRLPVVYLVDCSGLFLPEQSRSFSGPTGAGHIFTMNARLAAEGVPQIAGVFGDCIAGGGYMPIISDRVVMTEGAYMVIAGAALIKGAKALHLTSLDIGGPEVHVHQSRCADERVPDDPTAVEVLRAEVARLPSSGAEFYRHGAPAEPPRFDPGELPEIFPQDNRQIYDVEQVVARLVDQSLFHEVLAHRGREMVTGLARIGGLWVGIIANRQGIVEEPGIGRRAGGVLYREGIAKISAFSRACDDDGIPVIWLQDISGFDIGVEAEHLGLLGFGSNLIYGNSTARTPFFTVLLRKASGAGYYAMSGMPYEPVVQLSTPMTRLAVMEGRTLAIATYNSKLDDDFEIASTDPVERAEIEQGMAKTAARIEADMDPVRAAAGMDTDEVVPLTELRAWLECLVEAAWQSTGYRRTKNPRIWSVHDLEVLAGGSAVAGEPADAWVAEGALLCPTVGTWEAAAGEGSPLAPGGGLGWVHAAGRRRAVRVPPDTVAGVLGAPIADRSWVERGTALGEVHTATATGARPAAAAIGSDPSEAPPGVEVVRADTDGTFFARTEPGAPPLVSEGSTVARAATLGLVEVMKTFTPVRSPVAGEVVRVLAKDAGPVRAGQPLFWIRATP
jgi:acetyl-CoA carboxylase carboxyltransferase component/biotin carboxyl carrier protein